MARSWTTSSRSTIPETLIAWIATRFYVCFINLRDYFSAVDLIVININVRVCHPFFNWRLSLGDVKEEQDGMSVI